MQVVDECAERRLICRVVVHATGDLNRVMTEIWYSEASAQAGWQASGWRAGFSVVQW